MRCDGESTSLRQGEARRGCFGRPSLIAVVLMTGLALRWTDSAAADEPRKVRVVAGIAPVAYFVERVGGDQVNVTTLVGPSDSPHTFEPSPKRVAEIAGARVYFRIGVEFEKTLVPRFEQMFPGMRIVDLREGVKLRAMSIDCEHDDRDAVAHEHGLECAHDHDEHDHAGGKDPHTWLSPRVARHQAGLIAAALIELDPDHAETYQRNLAAFQAELDALHAELSNTLSPLRGRAVLVFHPAYGYFLDAYGLRQMPVQVEGKEPTAKQLVALIRQAQENDIRVVFVQPQFSTKSAEALARHIRGVVVPLDPLAPDYLANLRRMAANLKAGLTE